ncbi:MAG: CapA family protein [Myxococcaceae bacterium]|nr:CapA family protein [Myxococcaceae bacterium]
MLVLVMVLGAAPGAAVDVIFTGDVIPHVTVKETAKSHVRRGPDGASLNHDGWDHVFGPLTEAFRRADVAVVNLETPLTTLRRPAYGELVFNAPPAMAQALAAVGVTVATFANNHSKDQDLAGITQTRKHLREAGLLAAGAGTSWKEAWEPLCFDKGGLRLCFMAFTRFMNGLHNDENRKKPQVPIVDYDLDRSTGGISERQFVKKVREVAATCDALFVTPHWGEEYWLEPLQSDRRLAAAVIEAGAVAVIGNHPHVLQPVETVTRADGREGLVAFSLGNLVSSQGSDDMDTKRDGMLLQLTVRLTETGVTVARTRALPVWTDNRGKLGIQPVVADDEILAMRERLAVVETRDDAVSQSETRALKKRLEKAVARRARILSGVPKGMYEALPGTQLAEGGARR